MYERDHIRWSKREIALLGTMPDLRLARRLKRGVAAVRFKRQTLKIAPFVVRRPWTEAEIAELRAAAENPEFMRELDELRAVNFAGGRHGQVAAIAKKLHRSLSAVNSRLKRLFSIWRNPKFAAAA